MWRRQFPVSSYYVILLYIYIILSHHVSNLIPAMRLLIACSKRQHPPFDGVSRPLLLCVSRLEPHRVLAYLLFA